MSPGIINLKTANEQPTIKPTKDCSSAMPTQCSQKAPGNQSVIDTLTSGISHSTVQWATCTSSLVIVVPSIELPHHWFGSGRYVASSLPF